MSALLQAEAALQRIERWQGRFPLAERMRARERFAESYRIAGGRNAWFITLCATVGAIAGAVIRKARGIFSKE